MFIKKIFLKSFRNYSGLEQDFSPGINLIVGQNAQGKTNLLESLYILSMGKSFRTVRDTELIKWNSKGYVVKGIVIKKEDELEIKLKYLKNDRKRVWINNVEKKHLRDFVGKINVVVFSPQDLSIVKGEPSKRRSFIDKELIQVNPLYSFYTSQYNKVILQRNNLLRSLSKNSKDIGLLEVLNKQLAKYGTQILLKRQDIVRKLSILARLIQRKITGGKEDLEINYISTIGDVTDKAQRVIYNIFLDKLQKMKEKEIERGITLVGPHRDDLTFLINGIDTKVYGSQGQQRTTALSLKLAELEFIKSEVGDYPILLLDDVFSELDRDRQRFLLKTIKHVQTFITVTDGMHADIQPDRVFRVEKGVVKECFGIGEIGKNTKDQNQETWS